MTQFKVPSTAALTNLGLLTWLLVLVVVAIVCFLIGCLFTGAVGWYAAKFVVEFIFNIIEWLKS